MAQQAAWLPSYSGVATSIAAWLPPWRRGCLHGGLAFPRVGNKCQPYTLGVQYPTASRPNVLKRFRFLRDSISEEKTSLFQKDVDTVVRIPIVAIIDDPGSKLLSRYKN